MGNTDCSCQQMTYNQVIIESYHNFHQVFLINELELFRKFLQQKQMQKSRCAMNVNFPAVVNQRNSQVGNIARGIIIYDRDLQKRGNVQFFYGEIKDKEPVQNGVYVDWQNNLFKGSFQVEHKDDKIYFRKKEGKLYDENGKMVADGKWRIEGESKEEVFVEGTLKIVGGYDIMVQKDGYKAMYNDGSAYQGKGRINEEREFVRQGFGRFESPDKKYVYEGNWQNNKKHGLGLATYYDKDKKITYEGYFQKNQKYGKGQYKTAEYELVGQWRGNQKFKGELRRGLQRKAIAIKWNQNPE